jgi:hypothetical protein
MEKPLKVCILNSQDPREVFEIARVQNHDDFIGIEGLIRRGLANARDRCIDEEGVKLNQCQGAAKALRELLDQFELAKRLAADPQYAKRRD